MKRNRTEVSRPPFCRLLPLSNTVTRRCGLKVLPALTPYRFAKPIHHPLPSSLTLLYVHRNHKAYWGTNVSHHSRTLHCFNRECEDLLICIAWHPHQIIAHKLKLNIHNVQWANHSVRMRLCTEYKHNCEHGLHARACILMKRERERERERDKIR